MDWTPKSGPHRRRTIRMGTLCSIELYFQQLWANYSFTIICLYCSYDSGHNGNGVYVLELEDKKKKSVQEYEEEYNPYDHRVVQHPTTCVFSFHSSIDDSLIRSQPASYIRLFFLTTRIINKSSADMFVTYDILYPAYRKLHYLHVCWY